MNLAILRFVVGLVAGGLITLGVISLAEGAVVVGMTGMLTSLLMLWVVVRAGPSR